MHGPEPNYEVETPAEEQDATETDNGEEEPKTPNNTIQEADLILNIEDHDHLDFEPYEKLLDDTKGKFIKCNF